MSRSHLPVICERDSCPFILGMIPLPTVDFSSLLHCITVGGFNSYIFGIYHRHNILLLRYYHVSVLNSKYILVVKSAQVSATMVAHGL